MPPESGFRSTPQEWMRRARSDLALARQPKPDEAVWEDLCFHAQQAAEKALKAVLVQEGLDFPKTHDLSELLSVLVRSGRKVPSASNRWDDLTEFATGARYPGPGAPATEDEYHEALVLADEAVRWAEDVIGKGRKG